MPELRASGWFLFYRLPSRSQVLNCFRLAFGREPGQRPDYDPNMVGWWVGPISAAEMAAHRRRRAQQMAMAAMARTGEAGGKE